MGSWDLAITLDRSAKEPLYLQLVKAIESGIRKGRFKPGEALPGTRALADLLGVNRNTALAAYKELEAEGWITVSPDSGTFVAMQLPFALDSHAGIAAQDSMSWKRATARTEPFYQPPATVVDAFRLIPDLPDLRLAPTAAMLRDLRGLAVEAGNLVLTRGLMSTLNLVSRVLFAPGDAVAVEDPGSFRVTEAFRSAGARVFPVPVDREGLDVDALEALLARENLRLLYLSASPQYPTQVLLAPARRQRLLALAEARDFRILEGDPGLGFHREQNPSLPLASEDSHGRVIYFSGLEQILAPGLQVGFLAGPAELIKAMAQQRQLVDWPGNLVQEAAIEETLRDGEISRHLRRVRKITDERRETMVDRLLLHLDPAIQVRNPREGLSLWVKVAADLPVAQWVERCTAHGVILYPGSLYDFQKRPIPYLCLGFAAHNLDEQNEACRRMAEALKEAKAAQV